MFLKLTQNDTKRFIEFVLRHPEDEARGTLHHELRRLNLTEAEFCAGVLEHGKSLNFKSEDWFEFLKRVENRIFEHEKWLMDKLTPSQRQKLGFE